MSDNSGSRFDFPMDENGQPIVTRAEGMRSVMIVLCILAVFIGFAVWLYRWGSSYQKSETFSPIPPGLTATPVPTSGIQIDLGRVLSKPSPVPTQQTVFSADTTVLTSLNKTTIVNTRLGLSFNYFPASEYVLECPQLGEQRDIMKYYVIPISATQGRRSCTTAGQEPDVEVSRKEEFDGIPNVPTYERKKQKFLKQHDGYSVVSEMPVSILGLEAIKLTTTNGTLPIEQVYVTKDSVVYVFSPKILLEKYEVKFL